MSRVLRLVLAATMAATLGACAVVPARETVVLRPGYGVAAPHWVPGHWNAWGRWVPGHYV
jgi:hypothetical protein